MAASTLISHNSLISQPTPLQSAAIYCRVSTSGQEDGSSLETQVAACRQFAAEQGYAVDPTHVYCEVHTGAELDRPKLRALREAVRAGEVKVLIAFALDRLSREQAHLYILDHECARTGVDLLFVTEDFDKTPVGKIIRSVKGFAAELEREKIRERTMRGMRARLASGKLKPAARPLYGYRWADDSKGAYVVDEETAPNIHRAFEWAVEGVSLREIARRLTDAGIPTANGAARWEHSVIRRMLKHPGYKGVAIGYRETYTKERGKPKRVQRPEEEQVPLPEGTIPPIVHPDLWDAVQERLRRNQAEASRNNQNPETFLLRSGMVRCGYCGGAVRTMWSNNYAGTAKRPLYAVARHSELHYDCPSFGMSATNLDAIVWEKVVALVTRPEVVLAELEKQREDDPTAADLDALTSALDAVRKKQANLGRAVAVLDDAEAAAPLLAELKALGDRKRHLEAEREALRQRQARWQASQDHLLDLQGWVETVAANVHELTYRQKRDLLAALDVNVTLYRADHEPRYAITASIPIDGACIVGHTSW